MAAPKVLELDDVIRRHAWKLLNKRSNVFRRWMLDEADYRCEVDWKSLNLDHNVSKFDIRPDNRTFQTDWGHIRTGKRWESLLTCDFDNRTEAKQSHAFRASRETTTWISVDLHQGYTVSKEVDVDVTCPTRFDHFRAGRDTGFKVTKVKGNIVKEVMSWDVNSQVEILPAWKARAQLLARQESYVVDFEVCTTLTVPTGVLPVYFRRKSSTLVVMVDDLEKAFQSEEVEEGVLKEDEQGLVNRMVETVIDPKGKSQSRSKVQLITRGTCVCVAWSDQQVDIETEQLEAQVIVVSKKSHVTPSLTDLTQPRPDLGEHAEEDDRKTGMDPEMERLINGRDDGDVQVKSHFTPGLTDLIQPPPDRGEHVEVDTEVSLE